MNQQTPKIYITYNDDFIEAHEIEYSELKYTLKELATDSDYSFRIGDKMFWKKDINSVSIVNQRLDFNFSDVTEFE
jgi:hypothetical protein